jgi:hypothetical protein
MLLARGHGGGIGDPTFRPTAAELSIFARIGLPGAICRSVVHFSGSCDPANLERARAFRVSKQCQPLKITKQPLRVRRGGFVFQAAAPWINFSIEE